MTIHTYIRTYIRPMNLMFRMNGKKTHNTLFLENVRVANNIEGRSSRWRQIIVPSVVVIELRKIIIIIYVHKKLAPSSTVVVVVVVVVVFTLNTVLTSIQYPSLSYSSRQRNEFPWSHANPK